MVRAAVLWIFLVHLYQTQVWSSVPPVFVLKGKDFLLDVNNVPEKFLLFTWKLDKKLLVSFTPGSEPRVTETFTGRIDFSDKNNYSVILKNVTETDSGVYTAQVTTDEQVPLIQHNIVVQDVVSPVKLEVNSVSKSSGSCNVTLTCSTADSHINTIFRCVDKTCDQDGGNQSKVTGSSATLQVYMKNVTVICKHSNQVSSAENMVDIQHRCSQDPDTVQDDSILVPVVVAVVVPIIAIIGCLAAAYYYRKRTKNLPVTADCTLYADPNVEVPRNPDDAPDNDEASGTSPFTTYSVVGPHTAPSGATDTTDIPPESLYAMVEKPKKT